ncbi:MAG: amidohydrolase family protein, partial [Kiloniellales bacterium]|nr:amidohydrolase family protein [Kiloniellales bacterium]
ERTIIRGRWVIADSETVIDDGAVLVEGDRILETGAWSELRPRHGDADVLGSDRVAVMPGLVNAHHHSAGATALQHGLPDLLLEPWILMHARLRASDIHLDTLLSAARLLRTGVTAVVEAHSSRASPETYAERCRRALEAYDRAGIRAAFAAGLRDQGYLVHGRDGDRDFLAGLPEDLCRAAEATLPGPGDLDREDYLAILDELHAQYRNHPRLEVWFGPPGPPWVSDGFLAAIAERAEALDTGIQTHLEESYYERLHGPREYGRATLTHLAALGVLGPRFSIAHGVWLSEPEIEILADSGAAVSHNPSSNLRLRAGIAPLNALLAAGATVALGMDGTSLDDDEDMFTEMRLALRLNRPPRLATPAPGPAEIFALATQGGAKLLRSEDRLGRLAPGLQADLVVVDLERVTWPWTAPEAAPLDIVVQRAQAGDVATVLVGGEVVLADGLPTRFDLEAAGRELAERLAATPFPTEAAELAERLLPHLERYYLSWAHPRPAPYTAYNSRV